MPTGKIRFYDATRGFGFISDDDGRDVFLHASALPADVESLRPGTRVEFSVVDGRKGPQALSVSLLEPAHSIARSQRKPAADMVVIVEDLIKLLDQASNRLKAGRYPDRAEGKKIAAVMRAIADEFDA
ncbi:MAG TPA: cold shock domain-containing protein [Beutenbergiaceae bacterium]|nr:cold shock domain-containing protein [Beutenbergiaceae bacterium]